MSKFLQACLVIYMSSIPLSWLMIRHELIRRFNKDAKITDILFVIVPFINTMAIFTLLPDVINFKKIYKKFFLLK